VHARQLEVLNRGDAIVKVLALVQILYLIIQLITRKVVGLPSTQLEIGALAFSASSIITYIIYWNKPQGIESIQIIQPKCAPSRRRVEQIAISGPRFIWTNYRPEYESEKLYDVVTIPNDGMNYLSRLFPGAQYFGSNDEILAVAVGALLGGTLFGGLHCLAWNFHFPTRGEALTWRACSIITSSIPLLSAVPLGTWMQWHPWGYVPKKPQATRFAFASTLISGFLVPYVLARLFLVFEMFRSLLFLPPEAFVDTWSDSLPHWG
jgi:hypothetical protein